MMNKAILWTAADVVHATGGATTGTWSASDVCFDSRAVQAGDMFETTGIWKEIAAFSVISQ